MLALVVASAAVQAQAPAAAGTAAPAAAAACMACHGPGGQSAVPEMPSIAGQPKLFIENQLVLIREGLRDVPSMKAVMGTLDDAQIIALAQYFSAQPPATAAGPVLADRRRAGAEVSRQALCGTCHLADYRGQNQVPRLAGQQEVYLLATMKMYRDKPEPGRDTLMSAPLQGLKDSDLAGLAHYLAQHGR